MLDRLKNLKIVKKLNETISPKLRWLHFSKSSIDKSSPEYIKMISGVEDIQTNSDERRLEAMVREQLKEEFPNIENMKSYELLVDAVMHNLKKKQLQATDNLDIEQVGIRENPEYEKENNTPLAGVIFFVNCKYSNAGMQMFKQEGI